MTMPVRLARTTLFVPGSKPAMIAKAAASDADGVCLDLEDSVVAAEKTASRAHVVRALREIDFGHRTRILRINGVDGTFAYRDVIDAVEEAGDRIDLIMIPKVGSPRDVVFVDMLLSQIEGHRGLGRRIGLEAQIETAAGFLSAREIAAASPRLEALIFGPGDFAASMQMPSSNIGELDHFDELYPGHRWHAVMQTIVAAARANGLRCQDGPYAAYQDAAGLDRMSLIARALGFDGKQCIHPSQLATVNAVFSPTDQEVAKATAVVQAYEAASAAGQGAASHDGRMIDAVNLRLARTTLERGRLIATRGGAAAVDASRGGTRPA
jgi:malyl-CoA/(S)-citramalyl-CoA lyase